MNHAATMQEGSTACPSRQMYGREGVHYWMLYHRWASAVPATHHSCLIHLSQPAAINNTIRWYHELAGSSWVESLAIWRTRMQQCVHGHAWTVDCMAGNPASLQHSDYFNERCFATHHTCAGCPTRKPRSYGQGCTLVQCISADAITLPRSLRTTKAWSSTSFSSPTRAYHNHSCHGPETSNC